LNYFYITLLIEFTIQYNILFLNVRMHFVFGLVKLTQECRSYKKHNRKFEKLVYLFKVIFNFKSCILLIYNTLKWSFRNKKFRNYIKEKDGDKNNKFLLQNKHFFTVKKLAFFQNRLNLHLDETLNRILAYQKTINKKNVSIFFYT
jgi:hypothetical protein